MSYGNLIKCGVYVADFDGIETLVFMNNIVWKTFQGKVFNNKIEFETFLKKERLIE